MRLPGLRWYIIGLVFAATLINFLDRLTVSVLAPVIVADLGLSNQDFAWISTLFLITYSVSHALSGRLYDRLGVKRGFSISVVVWSLAAMAHAGARSAAGLGFWRAILGLGEAGNWPGAAKVISDWFPIHERAFAMAIFNSGAALGAVFAPPLIVFLQTSYGWQATFLVTGSLGFLWLLAWWRIYHPPSSHPWITEAERALAPPASTRIPPDRYLHLLRDRRTSSLVLARFFTDPVWWLYLNWLPLYLNRVHGLDLKQIAWFAPVPYLAADAGSLAGGAASGWLMRRGWNPVRARYTVIAAGVLLMAMGPLAALAKSPIAAIAAICCVTFGFQAWVNNVQVLPHDHFSPSSVGSVAGLGGLGAGVGAALFTLSTGWLVDHFGYTPVLLIAGGLPLLGWLALARFRRAV